MIFRIFCGRVFVGVICCMIALLSSGTASGEKRNPEKIVKSVKKTLDGIETLSCTFNYELVRKSADFNQHISGTIFMKKKFNFRVEYSGQTIVIDGKTVWTYLPKHNQVQISDFEHSGEHFASPNSIFDRYVDKREPVLLGEEEINGSDTDIIHLVSSDPEDNKVTVWIDRTLHFPVKAVEETLSGDVTTHVLSNVVINEKIDDDVFTFDPPEGVEVMDMRE